MLPLSGSPIYVIDKNWVCFSHPVCPPEKGRAYRFWVIFVIQVIKLWKSEMKGQDIKWGCISPPVHQISVFPLLSLHPIHACFRPKRKRREQNQESQMVREEFEKGGGNYAGRNQTTDITTIWEMVKKKKKTWPKESQTCQEKEQDAREKVRVREKEGEIESWFKIKKKTGSSLDHRQIAYIVGPSREFQCLHIFTYTLKLTYSHTHILRTQNMNMHIRTHTNIHELLHTARS